MSTIGFPTSSDIYIEAGGKKVAVVQSYKSTVTRSSKSVEAFGETEPVATIEGQRIYKIELTRLYATDDAIRDGINFYALSDFSLVIVKPDRRVVYTGCQWNGIEEDAGLGETVAEKISLVAAHRFETNG